MKYVYFRFQKVRCFLCGARDWSLSSGGACGCSLVRAPAEFGGAAAAGGCHSDLGHLSGVSHPSCHIWSSQGHVGGGLFRVLTEVGTVYHDTESSQ